MKSRRYFTALMILVICGCVFARADSRKRTGTSGATELTIPVGARDMGLAGSTVASTRGVGALFWNPAGAAMTDFGVGLLASHMQYIGDIGVTAAAVSVKFESFGVLSFHLKGLSIDPVPITTVEQPDGTGTTFTPLFMSFGLTYSRHITDRISIGATAMLIMEEMADVSANGFAFTLGIMYDDFATVRGLTFGLAIKNLGPQMTFSGSGLNVEASSADLNRGTYLYDVKAAAFELPTSIELGLAYELPVTDEHSILFSTSFENNNFADDDFNVGLEYSFQDLLFVRGGYNYSPSGTEQRENIFGPAFGVGVHGVLGGSDIRVDYALRTAKYFSSNHVFSFVLGL